MLLFYLMKQLLQKEVPIYERIFSFANLFSAWQDFKKRKQKKKDVAEFASNLIHNLSVLESDLLSLNYKHGEYFHFKISDPKPRDIHKALVRDRVAHHAIYRALYPYFDSKFIYDSYSCRIDKGTHKSINRFRSFYRKVSKNNTKTCWVLKCDIRKFFANIDHEILIEILEKHIKDQNILWLFSQVIDSFTSNLTSKTYGVNVTNSAIAENLTNPIYAIDDISKIGLPLGNLTSQLLVNIYMNEFDQFMKRKLKVKYYIRYADDFVILSDDKNYLENLLTKISNFLSESLKLSLHSDKVYIKTFASGVDFLGWVNFSHHRVLRTSTKNRMFKNLERNPKEESQQSYFGMLSHGSSYKLAKKLEKLYTDI